MRLRNKTSRFQSIDGQRVFPWRDVEVRDGIRYDTEIFELAGERPVKKKNIAGKGEPKSDFDLNDDGKVDDEDYSLAGRTLASKRNKR